MPEAQPEAGEVSGVGALRGLWWPASAAEALAVKVGPFRIPQS